MVDCTHFRELAWRIGMEWRGYSLHILCIFIAYLCIYLHIYAYSCILIRLWYVKRFDPNIAIRCGWYAYRRTSRRFQDDLLLKKKQRSSPRNNESGTFISTASRLALRHIEVANQHIDTIEESADSGHRTSPFVRGGEVQVNQAPHLDVVVHWDDGHGGAPSLDGHLPSC